MSLRLLIFDGLFDTGSFIGTIEWPSPGGVKKSSTTERLSERSTTDRSEQHFHAHRGHYAKQWPEQAHFRTG